VSEDTTTSGIVTRLTWSMANASRTFGADRAGQGLG
jgi:hypothetical protein